jgi:dolichyl-phosphate beta-glucosyltransferase
MSDSSRRGTAIIVVPCFNEEKRMRGDEFIEFAKRNPRVKFLFVDDGSVDGTREVLGRLRNREPEATRVLVLPKNEGKAEAVRQGVLEALKERPDYVGYWDADLATPLSELPLFLEQLERSPAVFCVVGSRVRLLGRQINRSWARHYLGRIFATAASLVIGLPIYDTQCGAKVFRVNSQVVSAFSRPFGSKWIFDVELLGRLIVPRRPSGTARATQEPGVIEVPLQQWEDVKGSKLRPSDFLKAACELAQIGWQRR